MHVADLRVAMRASKKFIQEALERYQGLLKLENWDITLRWDLSGDVFYAKCRSYPDTLEATVWINRDLVTTKLRADKYVRHELLHVMLSPITSELDGPRTDKLEENLVLAMTDWSIWRTS